MTTIMNSPRIKVTMTPFLLKIMLTKVIPEDIANEYQNGETDLDRLKLRVMKFFHAMGINEYPKLLEDINSLITVALIEIYDPEVQI